MQTLCVHPISPTYLPFHRYLYYTTLTLITLYPTPPPLIQGAFAFTLTYSSTAALYAVLILALSLSSSTPASSSQILNLDILPLYAILSSAGTLLLPLLLWNPNLRSGSARPIVRIWGIVVLIGVACTYTLLERARDAAFAPTASPGAAQDNCVALVAQVAALGGLKLRDPTDVETVDVERLFGGSFELLRKLAPLSFIPLAFGAVTCLVTIADSGIAGGGKEVSGNGVLAVADRIGGAVGTLRRGFVGVRRAVLWLTPGWVLPLLVVNEMYLLAGWKEGEEVPEGKRLYEVGQWGLLVGLGLVLVAGWVNWVVGGKERTKGKDWEVGSGDEPMCIA